MWQKLFLPHSYFAGESCIVHLQFLVRCEIFIASLMKIRLLYNTSPCRVTICFLCFEGPCCLRPYYSLATLNIEVGISSEMLVRNYRSTRSNDSQDRNIHLVYVPSNLTHCHQINSTTLSVRGVQLVVPLAPPSTLLIIRWSHASVGF